MFTLNLDLSKNHKSNINPKSRTKKATITLSLVWKIVCSDIAYIRIFFVKYFLVKIISDKINLNGYKVHC